MENITKILEEKMCCGCGACYSICPKECINIIEGNVNFPHIDINKCINCGKCIKVCPGNQNIKRILDNENINIEEAIEEIKVSYSTNYVLRNNSASGGVITQVISYMLENKLIDGAVVVTQSEEDPLKNTVKVVEDLNELYESQGSRYSPSSNCSILKEIINNNEYNKLVFVGKPCDIEAVNNMCKLNKSLNEKIVLKIAIMCNHTPTRQGLKKLLKFYNIDSNEIRKMKFRGNGWPGNFSIRKKDGQVFEIGYFEAWNKYLAFDYNEACNYCMNPFPLAADLIVGDPWGEEFADEKVGISLIIIRKNGMEIINELERINILQSSNVKFDDVLRYQKHLLIKHKDFKLNSLVFKGIHRHKVRMSELISFFNGDYSNILKYFKRIIKYRIQFIMWKYR